MNDKPARYWIGTISCEHEKTDFTQHSFPTPIVYAKGQQEIGNGGFHHWQLIVICSRPVRLSQIRNLISKHGHYEATRSERANDYVWKDDTSVAGTRFEYGSKPLKRNSKTDWDRVRQLAKTNNLDELPSDVYIRYYGNLKRIAVEHLQPIAIERTCYVFWGATGTGKSRRAWEEAGLDAYVKDPNTKWWCGYRGQKHVVVDEFRGLISISHMLRWTDRYPVLLETKGSTVPCLVEKIWITSNKDPREWYQELDSETLAALLRRLNITHFN